MQNQSTLIGSLIILGSLTTSQASAGPIQNSGTACGSTGAFTLTSVSNDSGYTWNGSQDASQCLSYDLPYSDEEQGLSDPYPNIGQYGDGLLNGQEYNYWVKTGRWPWSNREQRTGQLPPEDLVDPQEFQDLDGDGVASDPGWIHLAEIEFKEWWGYNYEQESHYSSSTSDGTTLFIGDLLDIEFDCDNNGLCSSGTWSLTPKVDLVEEVQAFLGNSTFDRLAFVVTKDSPFGLLESITPFLIYQFDFNELLFDNAALNLTTSYDLAGTWDMSGFCGGCSEPMRINAWARDPVDVTVPLPATLALLMIGALPLLARVRS